MIDRVMLTAQQLAAEGMAVLVLSQIKRGETDTNPPSLRDLKGSGGLEEKAKFVLALHEVDDDVELLTLKDSEGPKNRRKRLRFDKPTCRFRAA